MNKTMKEIINNNIGDYKLWINKNIDKTTLSTIQQYEHFSQKIPISMRMKRTYKEVFKTLFIHKLFYGDEHKIIWAISKKIQWLSMSGDLAKKTIDILGIAELKSSIEFFAFLCLKQKNNSEFKTLKNQMIKNYEYSLAKVFEVNGVNKPIRPSMSLSKLISTYAPLFKDIYKFLNYLQHNSLLPSALSKKFKEEIIYWVFKLESKTLEMCVDILMKRNTPLDNIASYINLCTTSEEFNYNVNL